MPEIECSLNPMTSEVEAAKPVSRLPGESGGFSVIIRLRLRVLSDYLFIWSGKVKLYGIEDSLHRIDNSIFSGRPYDVLQRLNRMLQRAEPVKDFYRVVNPRSRRAQPAIPGSTLKGAARARIELASYGGGGKVVADFLYPGGERDIVMSLPPRGMHGWRHARIWCESVAEKRVKRGLISVVDEVFGIAAGEHSLQGKTLFGTFYLVDPGLDCMLLRLDHGENVCAVPRGTTFSGEIRLVNSTPEEIGLVLYGLGMDKLLCNREPSILLGNSKYRCRELRDKGRKIIMGIVGVEATSFTPAPWDRDRWLNSVGVGDPTIVARKLVEVAMHKYPGLRKCFDEVSRRLMLEPCRQ